VTGTARHRQVVAGVLAADPALSAGQVETALRVVVTTPAALRALAAALALRPPPAVQLRRHRPGNLRILRPAAHRGLRPLRSAQTADRELARGAGL